jgi:hypothetical protein
MAQAQHPCYVAAERSVIFLLLQVLKVLRAAVFTGEALSSALLPRNKKKRHPHH